MKPLVIYHTNESTPCADGFGAAYAAWLKFGDEGAEYLPMKYGQEIPSHIDPTGRDLYILDFSFLPEEIRDFCEYCTKVVWLDHHAGVFKQWGKLPNSFLEDYIDECGLNLEDPTGVKRHHVQLDNTRSGAVLAWRYFHPGAEIPMFFKHLEDYDLWQFKIDKTLEFNTALQARVPWSFEQWKEMIEGACRHEMYLEGEILLQSQAIQVESVITSAATPCFFRIHDVDGDFIYEGLAANCPEHLRNEVGHSLAKKSGTFGMCWYQKANGMIKVSLRSNPGYDVLPLAKHFDGSGHKTAAGFEITNVTLQDLLLPF